MKPLCESKVSKSEFASESLYDVSDTKHFLRYELWHAFAKVQPFLARRVQWALAACPTHGLPKQHAPLALLGRECW